MKRTLTIFALLTTLLVAGQEPLTYTEVVQVDSNLTKDQLYSNARTWFAETFRSAQDVIQLDDKDEGKIIGKGNIRYKSNIFYGSNGTQGWIRYTIDIQVKDGRYKYELSNFIHEGNPINSSGAFSFDLITTDKECPYKVRRGTGVKWRNKVWRDIKTQVDSETDFLIESLKKSMAFKADVENNDW